MKTNLISTNSNKPVIPQVESKRGIKNNTITFRHRVKDLSNIKGLDRFSNRIVQGFLDETLPQVGFRVFVKEPITKPIDITRKVAKVAVSVAKTIRQMCSRTHPDHPKKPLLR